MSAALQDADLSPLASRPSLPALAAVARRVAVVLSAWDMRRRTRKALAKLGPEALEDIGLSFAEARTEARQPFWKA